MAGSCLPRKVDRFRPLQNLTMRNVKSEEEYYQILDSFWNKLSFPEQVLFRDIMAQATLTGAPPGIVEECLIGLDEFISRIKAVEQFKHDIWQLDFEEYEKKHWLDITMAKALVSLLEKFDAVGGNKLFEIDGIILQLWECPEQLNNDPDYPYLHESPSDVIKYCSNRNKCITAYRTLEFNGKKYPQLITFCPTNRFGY